MRIRLNQLRQIIREAVEHEDYNVQAAIHAAKERGVPEAEIEGAVASSANHEELIMYLDKLGLDQYPTAPEENE